jgi:hypothetical protein
MCGQDYTLTTEENMRTLEGRLPRLTAWWPEPTHFFIYLESNQGVPCCVTLYVDVLRKSLREVKG